MQFLSSEPAEWVVYPFRRFSSAISFSPWAAAHLIASASSSSVGLVSIKKSAPVLARYDSNVRTCLAASAQSGPTVSNRSSSVLLMLLDLAYDNSAVAKLDRRIKPVGFQQPDGFLLYYAMTRDELDVPALPLLTDCADMSLDV